MNVIGFLNSKGGVGKSTLCSAVAVRASAESPRVCIVDLDPQESVADWWRRRGEPDNPTLFKGADRASDAVEALALDGWDWVFLDGPPGSLIVTGDAVRVSDLVVIPMRASGLDLVASNAAIDLCEDAGVTFLVVINAAKGGAKDKLVDEMRSTLSSNKIPVATTAVTQRVAFVTAMSKGKTGAEMRDDEARKEIEALWQEIKSATLRSVKARGKKGSA